MVQVVAKQLEATDLHGRLETIAIGVQAINASSEAVNQAGKPDAVTALEAGKPDALTALEAGKSDAGTALEAGKPDAGTALEADAVTALEVTGASLHTEASSSSLWSRSNKVCVLSKDARMFHLQMI